MSLSQPEPELDALAALLAESLRARAGDVLTPDVIDERARNIAQTLSVAYVMRPVAGPHVFSCTLGRRLSSPHDDRCRCKHCGKPPGGDHLPGDES